MALTQCPDCEMEFSDSAKQCPNCGYRNTKPSIFKSKDYLPGLILGIFGILAIFFGIWEFDESYWMGGYCYELKEFLFGVIGFVVGIALLLIAGYKLKTYTKYSTLIAISLCCIAIIGMGWTFIYCGGFINEMEGIERQLARDEERLSVQNTLGQDNSDLLPYHWVYLDGKADLISVNTQRVNSQEGHLLLTLGKEDNFGQIVTMGIVDEIANPLIGYEFSKTDFFQYTPNEIGYNAEIKASFDNGTVQKFNALAKGTGIGLTDPDEVNKFISQLKNAQTCTIILFLTSKAVEFKLNCDGLNWD